MTCLRILLIFILVFTFGYSNPSYSNANQSSRIKSLEKRVDYLERELARLKLQEEKASKYLNCLKKVDGNTLTIPFKIISCIKK
jgi:hypothetical protein